MNWLDTVIGLPANLFFGTGIPTVILVFKKCREVIEKYSHAASLEEIAENEYNLNIPRYVDTFEEEEPVDLDAVVAELKTIEAEIGDVDKRIIEQCKELGIAAPVFSGGK